MTNYLTPDEVERLHDDEVNGEFDLPGVDHAQLETAVMRPQTSAFGEDAFPTIHDKAAALFTGLIELHPFTDGNKRTAVIATHTFYLLPSKWLHTGRRIRRTHRPCPRPALPRPRRTSQR